MTLVVDPAALVTESDVEQDSPGAALGRIPSTDTPHWRQVGAKRRSGSQLIWPNHCSRLWQHLQSESQEERAYIVQHAYISSKRRERYVGPIDKIIRALSAPSIAHIETIEDSEKPTELTSLLARPPKTVENQVILLVGSVGSGKTTFIDYLAHCSAACPHSVCNGQTAMFFVGDFAKTFFEERGCGAETIGYIAAEPPGTPSFLFGGHMFLLARSAAHRDTALEFLKVVGGTEGQEAFALAQGSTIPTRRDADPGKFDLISQQTMRDWSSPAETFVPIYATSASSVFQASVAGALEQFVNPSSPVY